VFCQNEEKEEFFKNAHKFQRHKKRMNTTIIQMIEIYNSTSVCDMHIDCVIFAFFNCFAFVDEFINRIKEFYDVFRNLSWVCLFF
jgi:hypothetical protein